MKNFIFLLTFSRIIGGPIIFLLILFSDAFLLSLFLFIIFAITDFFDGYLARKYNQVSKIGSVMDPIADKIMILFVLVGLSLSLDSSFIAFMACLILMREFWVSGLRDFNAQSGNSYATEVLVVAKYKTTSQQLACCIYLLGISIESSLTLFLADFFLFFALILTLYSGLAYTSNTFKK
tara:strand:- start:1103 stop:1639 length:537 start_codon:yes stop_codon:yes gene_type:complete